MTTKTYTRLQSLAARALAEVFFNGGLSEDVFITCAESAGVRAEIRITRTKTLTDCERDLLQLLCGQSGPRTQPEIFADVDQAGIIHGESTMRNALAALRKRSLVEVGARGGYRITAMGEEMVRAF